MMRQEWTLCIAKITTNVAMIQRISTLERKVYNLEQRMNQQDRTYQAN